jgi:hypothetical protein
MGSVRSKKVSQNNVLIKIKKIIIIIIKPAAASAPMPHR